MWHMDKLYGCRKKMWMLEVGTSCLLPVIHLPAPHALNALRFCSEFAFLIELYGRLTVGVCVCVGVVAFLCLHSKLTAVLVAASASVSVLHVEKSNYLVAV